MRRFCEYHGIEYDAPQDEMSYGHPDPTLGHWIGTGHRVWCLKIPPNLRWRDNPEGAPFTFLRFHEGHVWAVHRDVA